MDVNQIQNILTIVGAVAVGLPALLSAAAVIARAIPGEQPDKLIEWCLGWSDKFSDIIRKIMTKPPVQ